MQFLIENVISAGVQRIIGLMTPASAFIKACKAIYDIVKFLIDHAQQIADLINSILDAIGLVASGAIDKAAQAVEDSLAKAVPVAIGFFASIPGLGNISTKVQSIIQKMRQPIDKAIDWVIDQGMKAYKKVSNKLKKSKLGKKFSAAKKKAKQKLKETKEWGKNKQKAVKEKDRKKKTGQADKRTEQQKKADLRKAVAEAEKFMQEPEATPETVKVKLPKLQSKYGLKSAKLEKVGDSIYYVLVEINPKAKTDN